jgi:hypothetical protein
MSGTQRSPFGAVREIAELAEQMWDDPSQLVMRSQFLLDINNDTDKYRGIVFQQMKPILSVESENRWSSQ